MSCYVCYITHVMLRFLYNICDVMLYDMSCYITCVSFWYITCVVLCYITRVMLCYITYVMLCYNYVSCYVI